MKVGTVLVGICCSFFQLAVGNAEGLYHKDNLVAWCVVPFDASQRGPEARSRMLSDLGIRAIAYDWRDKDIPSFDLELDSLKEAGIKLQAFWCPVNTEEALEEPHVKAILASLERKAVATELWVMLNNELLEGKTQEAKVEKAVSVLSPLANRAAQMGCTVGLYNHGGWFGNPDNQIEILRKMGRANVGIVYNFHHGHEDIDRFEELMSRMKPYLLYVGLNGMTRGGPKILSLGKGENELEMMRVIKNSGYSGPVGILDHQEERDTEEVLRENLEGMKKLLRALGDLEALETY